ncbi:FAD:protein FMN transferase [Brevibacillus fluminis]|uniref:FAD:protein FMN transferase n=1 Tax=Brevibacillus fluminis TaxID=511487 RepID=UPI003F88D938
MAPFRELSFRAMNTDIQVSLGTDVPLQEDVTDWFARTEKRFSRFLPDSELSRINQLSGKTTLISAAMAEVLALAEMYRHKTGGIFHFMLLDALQHAGYSRSFEQLAPMRDILAQPPVPHDCQISLNASMRSVKLGPGTHLDLGGIVKGWSVDRLGDWLKREKHVTRGFLNAGGDLLVWGGFDEDEPWLVGIADPRDNDVEIAQVALVDGAVATSSVLGRRWQTKQGDMHHLIDPRTLRPSKSEIVQCTIVGSHVTECEVWAKVACIVGLSAFLPLFGRHLPHCDALLVTQTGELHFAGDRNRLEANWHGTAVAFIHDTIEQEGWIHHG